MFKIWPSILRSLFSLHFSHIPFTFRCFSIYYQGFLENNGFCSASGYLKEELIIWKMLLITFFSNSNWIMDHYLNNFVIINLKKSVSKIKRNFDLVNFLTLFIHVLYWSMSKHKPKHKLEKWFIISGDGVRPSVRPYKTKQTDQRVKPLFKLVLWLMLGRGLLYDSSLVSFTVIAA